MTSEEQPNPAVSDPAGQQLRRAREAHGLSIEQVADAQHLRPTVIQDIEQGNYEKIDSELFLKGYVRAYAKQVNLDAGPLLAVLDQELEPRRAEKARELEANPLISIERKKRRKRRVAKALAWLVLLLVIVYGFMALLETREPGIPENDEAVPAQSEGVAPSDAGTVPAADDRSFDTSQDVSEPRVTDPGADSGVLDEPPSEDGAGVVVSSDAETSRPVPVEDEPVSEAPPVEDADLQDVARVEQQPEPALASGPLDEPVAPMVSLEISFIGDCWVQVRDANGDQLAAALKRSGEQLNVEGVPPMSVVVGAVDAVSTISFDNEPVDMKGFRVVNNRTEFTLSL